MRGSLQSARLADLEPGDLVEFICQCRYEVAVRPMVLRALRGKRFIPDDMKVAELALRWRCQNCGYRGPESRVRVISTGPARVRW
jgi:hypothetical protein